MQKASEWPKYYENQKKLWYDPSVSIYVKGIVRLVELHRSDSKGWSISVRRIASLLGISTNTAIKYIDKTIQLGLIETSQTYQRRRRKLRLSVSLRAPVEFETSSSSNLSHWHNQSVSPSATPTVSTGEPLNNKEISNANINESPDSQLKKERIAESLPYKEETPQSYSDKPSQGDSEGLKKLREKMKELGLLKKKI